MKQPESNYKYELVLNDDIPDSAIPSWYGDRFIMSNTTPCISKQTEFTNII